MTTEQWTDERLRGVLREEYPGPVFRPDPLRRLIEASLLARSRWAPRSRAVRAVLAVAAGLALFLAGAAYGRRTAHPINSARMESAGTPFAIQGAGSAYVARLASFSAGADTLPTVERDEAREVALATLYAAMVELLHESQDDKLLAYAARMIYSRREAQRHPERQGTIWF